MTNHPSRSRRFQLDGHTGDWLVCGGDLRLRPVRDGSVVVIGRTHVQAGTPEGFEGGFFNVDEVVLTHNTPRRFQPLVGCTFPSLAAARAAVMAVIAAPAIERKATNDARLGDLAGLTGPDRDRALAALKWLESNDAELREKGKRVLSALRFR